MVWFCGSCAKRTETDEFKLCSCKMTHYCSDGCRNDHWEFHKERCTQMRKVQKTLEALNWKEESNFDFLSAFTVKAYLPICRRIYGPLSPEKNVETSEMSAEICLAEAIFEFCCLLGEFRVNEICSIPKIEEELKAKNYLVKSCLFNFLSPSECFSVVKSIPMLLMSIEHMEEAYSMCKARIIAMEECLGDFKFE